MHIKEDITYQLMSHCIIYIMLFYVVLVDLIGCLFHFCKLNLIVIILTEIELNFIEKHNK